MHRQFLRGKLSEAALVSNYVLPITDGIQMSLWGIAWLTCLCGSMEDAWRQNCRLALERNSLGSFIPMIAFVVWDVENMWLQNNLIWISSCREMKGAWDLKIRREGSSMAWGLTKPTMGGSSYNGARLHAVEHFCLEQEENIWRMDNLKWCNLRRQFGFSGYPYLEDVGRAREW